MPPTTANAGSDTRLEFAWVLESQTDAGTLPLHRFPAILGRRPDSDVCVPQASVSGRHAEFLYGDVETLLVRDLGSTNGTFVNGRRIEQPCALSPNDLLHFGEALFRVGRRATGEGNTINVTRCALDVCDQALALVQFDRLLTNRVVTPHFQPIVNAGGDTAAYEVLGRSPLFGLNTPGPMFRAAAALHKEAELSRLLRMEAIRVDFCSTSPHLFVNTHPSELQDIPELIASLVELRHVEPSQCITLELHESAAPESGALSVLRKALTDLRIGLAYDDFGAGQARLSELVETAPDYVKFDMRLIRGIHAAPEAQRKMVASLVQMVRDLGVTSLAEGVECGEEAEVCCRLGFELLQGFYFGRPAPAPQYFGVSGSLAPTDAGLTQRPR